MTNEERLWDAVGHMQEAARQMIAAARVVLDVAEELVDDPTPLVALATQIADLAGKGRSAAGPHADGGEGPDATEAPSPAPRVQHIRVS